MLVSLNDLWCCGMSKNRIAVIGGIFLIVLIYAFVVCEYNPLYLLLIGPGLFAISKRVKKK